jgi:RNA-directed DNA polymerase
VISPLLANIYLHYVFDLWERWRRHHGQGNIILVRYADDIVAGFEHQADAERFQAELRDRLAQFALTLHPDKTRLIQFGRRAAEERERVGSASRRPSTSSASPISAVGLGAAGFCSFGGPAVTPNGPR